MFDLPTKERRVTDLDRQLAQPGVWDDPQSAGALARETGELRDEITGWANLEQRARDLVELAGLAADDPDLAAQVKEEEAPLEHELRQRELDLLFADPHSDSPAVVTISAGQGGVEAQDWVEMLLRMYSRWAQPPHNASSVLRPGGAFEVIDVSAGEEAGLKSVTFVFRGKRAYGLLRAEHGVHRLVRISPFDQQHRRHTSFALVEVMPELDAAEEGDIVLDADELRIDTYRSTGAGGQHVNKTDSAVRITHLPTGIVVSCQNERSQMKNRDLAMKVLRARLFQRRQEEAAQERSELRGEVLPAEFGSQIRNYVLQPYTLVKDLRSGVELGNVQAVLDGEIEPLLEGWLRWRVGEAAAPVGSP